MDLGIQNKTALVMGASSGLGKAIAIELIANGVKTAICARNPQKLQAVADQIGAIPIAADLSDMQQVSMLCREAENALGSIDILVANTGGPPKATFTDTSESLWSDAFQSLFLSTTTVIRHFLPTMTKKQWGRIIINTSISAKEPIDSLILSNSIRAGILGLAKSLSSEVAKNGITVNAILPGFIETPRLIELGADLEKIGASIPAGRVGQAQELGALAAFLASANASYITGQAIAVDGGLSRSI